MGGKLFLTYFSDKLLISSKSVTVPLQFSTDTSRLSDPETQKPQPNTQLSHRSPENTIAEATILNGWPKPSVSFVPGKGQDKCLLLPGYVTLTLIHYSSF